MPRQTVAAARWYRPDITGLRTLAIVPVVAFHAGASFLPGGFVGVDIFYAISGFLITTLLVREASTTGRIAFGTFWAKRIRRLVPVLVLVVVVTLPVAALVSSVLSWDTLAAQGTASVFYVSNILYWRQSTDYFSDGASLDPFLHTWSLSVEEQFYILWPVMIALVWLIARRLHRVGRPVVFLAAAMATVFVASLAFSIFLSPRDPSAAFYLLPTRAWEFAAGGLVALLPLSRMLRSRRAGTLTAAIGIAAILWSLLFIRDTQPFPGAVALVPVLGALSVIAAGGHRHAPEQPTRITSVLSTRPFVWIGEVSYSWYLWHWPFIVIAAAVLGDAVWWVKPAAGALSLGAAALSYRFVENRLRFSPTLTASVRRTYLAGGALTATAAVLALGVVVAGSSIAGSEPIRRYAEAASALPSEECTASTVTAGGVELCRMGDTTSSTVMMLVGDSHAGQWKAAMSAAAERDHIQLVVRWRNACPAVVVTVAGPLQPPDPECRAFQEETRSLITELEPDAVIVSDAFAYIGRTRDAAGEAIPIDEQVALWTRAYDDYIDVIGDSGAVVAMVDDNPRVPFDAIECLTTLGGTRDSCSVTREEATDPIAPIAEIQAAALQRAGVDLTFSVGDEICDEERCEVLDQDGVPIFLDDTHLSDMWTQQFETELEGFLESIVAERDASLRPSGSETTG